jgi:riboflavin synthase
MFTGIIEAKGKIRSASLRRGLLTVRIDKPKGWKLKKGESISIDGICSTVVGFDAKSFSVEYMEETLSKTTARDFKKGTVVNLERSLTLQSRLDGHMVQGHVDNRARVSSVEKGLVSIDLPRQLVPFAALHGSIAINGVSLTIARTKGNTITVALIPFTISRTNLGALAKGDFVNVEVDLLARYSANILKHARLMHHAKKKSRKNGKN